MYLSTGNETRPRERSGRGRLLPLGKKASSYRGSVVRTEYHCLISLSVCVRVYVTFVVFTDCENSTRPISTKHRSVEAGEYELTRGTCFVVNRLELVAVAGLLWISCVIWVGRDFFFFFLCVCFCIYVSSSNALGLLQV